MILHCAIVIFSLVANFSDQSLCSTKMPENVWSPREVKFVFGSLSYINKYSAWTGNTQEMNGLIHTSRNKQLTGLLAPWRQWDLGPWKPVLSNIIQKPHIVEESSDQKSNNLQYNVLVCWFAGTYDSSTKRLMFQVLSFFSHNFLQKWFQFTFL